MGAKNWKLFYLKDLFSVEKGKRLTVANRIDGNIPFVTAGHENSGISSFIGNEDLKIYENSITIDMFAEAFFRNYSFCCDDNIHVLTPKEDIDKYVSLFIVAVINSYEFMSNFMKEIEKQQISKYEDYLNNLKSSNLGGGH